MYGLYLLVLAACDVGVVAMEHDLIVAKEQWLDLLETPQNLDGGSSNCGLGLLI